MKKRAAAAAVVAALGFDSIWKMFIAQMRSKTPNEVKFYAYFF